VFRHTISSRWAHIVVFTSQTGSTDTQLKDFMTPFRLCLVLSRRSSMPTSFGSIWPVWWRARVRLSFQFDHALKI
jgi:hypothetical protein